MFAVTDVMALREEDDDVTMESSTESLSQQYQFENKYNNLLPYAGELDDEARNLLADIKSQLGRGVMLRRMRPDCYLAALKLRMYLKLYNFRFSKEDHIIFIKLMYELIIIPSLEPNLINSLSITMIALLKKEELIAPNELELQWRPLYDLVKRAMARSSEWRFVLGMQRCTILKTLHNLIHRVKVYFPVTATQEILDELRPKLCPIDPTTMERGYQLLEYFLPLRLMPQDHDQGHKLWFAEFMKLWEVYHNGPFWEHSIMSIIAALAHYNIGYIDWEPHIPLMFTRFMRSLNLPVLYKKCMNTKPHKINMHYAAEWIVSILGNGSSGQLYLEKFLKAIETYFHQANYGPWLERLKELLSKLATEFVGRLHHERFGKNSWIQPIPDSHKLTNADVDAFVKCMMPVAMTAMFGNSSVISACKVLRLLATIRPNMVIPCVLDRLYSTLDTLTEPHKFTAALMAVTAVARPMAQGRRNVNQNYTYNEGPTRVIPLLFSALPGIDANDIKKSFVTFRLIYVYAMAVPIIDCSKVSGSDSLDEHERIACEQSAEFEDFVLQFFDRVFSLIESSTLEYVSHENQDSGTGKSKTESLMEYSLMPVCTILLLRTSNDIFRSALHKLKAFLTDRILETRVSGPLAAAICRSFSRVNGRETLRALLPTISENILEILEEGDVAKDERINDRLLYPMLLVSSIVFTEGVNLLPYMETLTEILDKTLHLKSREGSQMASRILMNILHSLSSATIHNFTLDGRDLNDSNHPYILDWGEGADTSNINLHWYVPGEQEIATMQRLFSRYVPNEITKIQEYCSNKNADISRPELLTSLVIINALIDGCGDLLKMPNSSSDDPHPRTFISTVGITGEVLMPDGSNVREFLVKIMSELQVAMLKNSEDDTKSLFILLGIWSGLLLGRCRTADRHKNRWTNWKHIKTDLKDELVKRKKILPECLVERVGLQHEHRVYSRFYNLTEYHKFILFQLFELATSRYAKVRLLAQDAIFLALPCFPYSGTIFLPRLLELLAKDPEEEHEALKGLLYLLLGPRTYPLILLRDWSYLRKLWPALVLSKPSEKMSVIKLKNNITDTISRSISTVAIKIDVPDSCVNIAAELWNNGPKPSTSLPSEMEINEGVAEMQELEKMNEENYDGILHELLDAIEQSSHWRQRAMGMKLIKDLAHLDRPYPPEVVNYFLGALIHDSLEERKIATVTVVCMLGQQKREHVKIEIDVPEVKEKLTYVEQTIWTDETRKPGVRTDNSWLQYNYDTRPVTQEQWDEPRFIHELHVGYYAWPTKLQVYGPSSMQPELAFDKRNFSEAERFVDLFFAQPQNVEKLIQYNSLEERKGKDKFNVNRFLLYKGIFRNHGSRHLDLFIPHLQSLVSEKNESSQRCAAEIIAGLIRGAKHWPFSMAVEMQKAIMPIIRQALENVTTETSRDWELCFATALARRDPNKYSWLLECLMEAPELESTETSYQECQRLFILHAILVQQSWRVADLMKRLLERVERKLLTNPFQNVRDTLGSSLMVIFTADYNAGTLRAGEPTPCAEELMNRILPRISKLAEDDIHSDSKEEATLERASDISILKTICKWLISTMLMMSKGCIPRSADLLPILCQFENSEADEELRKICTFSLASLSEALILPQHVNPLLDVLEKISHTSSWSSRASCLCYIEVFVFHNMPIIVSNSAWVERVEEIVLRLLADENLEVREKAGQVLCGLLHCAFMPNQDKLLSGFETKSKIKIKNLDDLRIRHAGVLGLCAFIRAHPYDVPRYVPSIFGLLNLRLNDPQPVPSTIRKTLGDFKRTHYDGWASHAQSFTKEQLAILQDLVAPPSYYA